ncbi:MAG TPA: GyrI-like domain-containing protein [Methanomicrobiales archaeon]|nr:GyrI-like domain-containing protein [Methanomicrobiales archaeon]
MTKIDLKKQLSHLHNPPAHTPVLVDVPSMQFLMVDGKGDPGTSQEYRDAMEALYALSYTLKFMVKKGEQGIDYVVPPLEGLWWAEKMEAFRVGDRNAWQWTSLIMQPEVVTVELFERARAEVGRKKDPPALRKVRFLQFHEGLSAQVLHMGPFAGEGPTVERLHTFIQEKGYRLRGKHHEIYLSDPRRIAPEKMKTILRQPVEPA